MRNAYKVLVEKSEGKRPLGTARQIWEGSIKMDLNEILRKGVDSINVAQDRDIYSELFGHCSGSIKAGNLTR
jgi:hypothetical protein